MTCKNIKVDCSMLEAHRSGSRDSRAQQVALVGVPTAEALTGKEVAPSPP
jgi:hypothetical protein